MTHKKQITKPYLNNPIYSLLLVLMLFTSCNGQVKTDLPNNNSNSPKENNSGQPKIIKTQGSNEYQNTHCGLQDKAGNLWFGTTGEGVYQYNGKLFKQFTIQNGLSSNTVWTMLEDKKGNIWFGTNKGLCCYDGKTIKQISISLNTTYQSNYSASANTSLINEVFSIMQDKKGMLWFGTTDGVVCYDGNNFTSFINNNTIINDSSLTLKGVQCMLEDKKGNIWFGSGPMAFEGLCLYNGKSLTKVKLKNENWIRKITEDKNGNILIATRRIGLITYDGKNLSDIPKPAELKNSELFYVLTDSKENIWFGSDYINDNDVTTGGFWKLDGKTHIEFTKKDGLGNTAVSFILEDRNGNIWVGTRNSGLYRYDGKTFTSYSE